MTSDIAGLLIHRLRKNENIKNTVTFVVVGILKCILISSKTIGTRAIREDGNTLDTYETDCNNVVSPPEASVMILLLLQASRSTCKTVRNISSINLLFMFAGER